ncbi:MAG TPA: DUF1648 domain-containing protein [Pyrinomonadaceae bacterium]|jgi:uncharacterized membrane protein
MGDAQVAAAGMLFGEAILLIVFAWLPVMRGARAFFGVRVAADAYRGEGRRVLRRYRLTLFAIVGASAALGYYAAARAGQPLFCALATVAASAAAFAAYGGYARRVRPLAVRGEQTRFASPLAERRLADHTRAWVEVVTALLVFATAAALAHYYPRMPARVPTHWDAAGAADAWARKSFTSIFFLPVLGAYLQLFFFVLKRDLARAKMTLPAERAEEYLRGKEKFLRANMSALDLVRVSVAALFFGISLLLLSTALPELGRLTRAANAFTLAVVAAMTAGVAYFVWRMAAVNAETGRLAGDDYAQRAGDEGHWRHGGLTYYNPEDSALVVEKLVGLGYTINMAHPGARRRLMLLAPVPLFVVWAVVAL